MLEKLNRLYSKHKEPILYLVFGVLTTLTNYLVYLPLYNLAGWSASVSNIVAWVAAVIVAFITNKGIVFGSTSWSPQIVVPEFLKFLGFRVATGVMETVLLLILVDIAQLNGNLWKILISVIVVIVNYVASKLVIFKR